MYVPRHQLEKKKNIRKNIKSPYESCLCSSFLGIKHPQDYQKTDYNTKIESGKTISQTTTLQKKIICKIETPMGYNLQII